jgi:LmbE family N-acetylglucosaminyl deacetylase
MDMKTILVLSPHLDDAVLSLGGMMAHKVSQGYSVVVYNLFCAPYHGPLSPAAQRLHEGWGDPEDITALRLQEDRQALEVIGAQQIIGDARDLIYRQSLQGTWLYTNMEEIQGERNPEDNALVDSYFRKLSSMFSRDKFDIFTPLGVGGHIDHMLAFDIGVHLHKAGYAIKFYEDLPYAMREDYLNARLTQIEGMLSSVELFPLEMLARKIEALHFYQSQIDSLFENEGNMRVWVREQALRMSEREDMGGEKVWELP